MAGVRITVLEPSGTSLTDGQNWFLAMIQGTLTGYFNKYSPMTVLDRQRLETILDEQEKSASGIYSDEDYVRIGNLTNAQYIVAGSLSRTPAGLMLELGITDVETGQRKASFPPRPCTLTELQSQAVLKEAFEDLITQMGVSLTSRGKDDLRTVRTNAAEAEAALAQGIAAQRSGTVVEALSHFIQAVDYAPDLAEAESRLNIITANVTSGNIGADVRNDLQWRDQWVARLKECEEFYANYMKEPQPGYLVYSTNIKQGEIDYEKRTVPLSINMAFCPVSSWYTTINKVVQTVKAGLEATGRASTWRLNWPAQSISSPSPFVDHLSGFSAMVEIINAEGKSIAKQGIGFPYGSVVNIVVGNVALAATGSTDITFPTVDPYAITDDLTIRYNGLYSYY
jgi:hypothetical protein